MTEQKAEYKPSIQQSPFIEGYYAGYAEAVLKAISLVKKLADPQLESDIRMLLAETTQPVEIQHPTVNGIPILLETWLPEGCAVINDGRKLVVLDMDHPTGEVSQASVPIIHVHNITNNILQDAANKEVNQR